MSPLPYRHDACCRVLRVRSAFAIACALGLAIASAPTTGAAFEPGTDDARAGMCAPFDGVAFTFCVALCEARECDRQPLDDERCAVLRGAFDRASGGGPAPCETTGRSSRQRVRRL
jgi:hypothetical protein